MKLEEQIAKIKEFGITESDLIIQHLLSKNGFDVAKAVNYYFEHGLSGVLQGLAKKPSPAKGYASLKPVIAAPAASRYEM